MRDIPVFTTSNGVASLILKKIPYTKEAYVYIRDSRTCWELLNECVDLCRMAGAEKVFATGHDDLHDRPLYCTELRYSVSKEQLPNADALALPVTTEQKDWWRQIYNQKMAHVPAAAPLSLLDTEELIKDGKAFCIYRDCSMLGIGVAYEDQIYAVASILPGTGKDVVLALADTLETQKICLSVASTNEKAIKLYRRLGFAEIGAETYWYQIF